MRLLGNSYLITLQSDSYYNGVIPRLR